MLYQHQIALGLMAGAMIGILWHQLLVLRRSRGRARGSSRRRAASLAGAGTPTTPLATSAGGRSPAAASIPSLIPPRPTLSGWDGNAASAVTPGLAVGETRQPMPLDETFAGRIAIAQSARRAGAMLREVRS